LFKKIFYPILIGKRQFFHRIFLSFDDNDHNNRKSPKISYPIIDPMPSCSFTNGLHAFKGGPGPVGSVRDFMLIFDDINGAPKTPSVFFGTGLGAGRMQ
jgi:hypothetical protein